MTEPIPLRTKSGLPRHCYWETDRHGKRRVRFRKGAVSAYPTGIPWTERFMRQYAVQLERLQTQGNNVGACRTAPGSFDARCVSYYNSPDFHRLKAKTQPVRRNITEHLRPDLGRCSVRDFQRRDIERLMAGLHATPQQANNILKVLRVLFAHAVADEMITSNPAVGVKRYKSQGDGFATWSEDDLAAFEAAYPVGTQERLAFALALYTGQRIGDVARMGWQHVKNERIEVRQEKTSATLLIPLHPELARVLAAVPRDNLTFLLTDKGAPF